MLFNDCNIDWTAIYTTTRCYVSYVCYMRSFQYEIINNALFLNKKLHNIEIKPSPSLHSTPLHLSVIYTRKHFFTYSMNVTVLNIYVRISLILPTLTPQTVIFLDS